ncbi:poly-gamma-glutamate hydrolase family protein [Rhizobium leguminosarum]|uniref:poly-gamma-glutamate hydrolase family protein n=1 Tax=Rhizobium leguminosarum TaxID=384 RepID=UPI0021BC2676|nr:poly-gamma-glutamate hydrolase family protein [Rhizobium leguminosarum]
MEGVDFRIGVTRIPVAIVAPHRGHIEPHTSEIAAAIAGEDFSLYLFEGLNPADIIASCTSRRIGSTNRGARAGRGLQNRAGRAWASR